MEERTGRYEEGSEGMKGREEEEVTGEDMNGGRIRRR